MEHKPKRYKDLLHPGKVIRAFGGSLANEFIVPPFSILDAASPQWQQRRRAWGKLDMLKVSGRDRDMSYHTDKILKDLMGTVSDNTSRFDPVLAEIMYTWFCKEDGMVLDPFAGGHVRGVVAAMLMYGYIGIDLSQRQVDDNNERLKKYTDLRRLPLWVCGDSSKMSDIRRIPRGGDNRDNQCDFVFSCPPYFDLEKYTDNPDDLSNLSDKAFRKAYKRAVWYACDRLAEDRFAAFVVGDVRDEEGHLRGLPALTVQAFEEAGLSYYNDIILADPLGSAILRARRNFIAGKVSKVHQYVLVFVKGDARKAFAQTRVGRTMVEEMKKEKEK